MAGSLEKFCLAFLASWQLGLHPIFGLALGATSVGLPLAVLGETGHLKTGTGQAVIGVELDVIDVGGQGALILLAVASGIICPIGFRAIAGAPSSKAP